MKNYYEHNEINELIQKFHLIRKKGYIKSINNNYSGIGLTFENELGLEQNRFSGPDFKGIEIKTHLAYSKSWTFLFSLIPANGIENNTKNLIKYGYDNLDGGKNLIVRVGCSKISYIRSGYGMKLRIDRINQLIFLEIYNTYGQLIDNCIYWNYVDLWSTFIQKLNCMAMIKVWPTTRNHESYYKYYDLHVYYLKLDNDYYHFLENDTLMLNINIGSYKYGEKKGEPRFRGFSICLAEENFDLLFNKLF